MLREGWKVRGQGGRERGTESEKRLCVVEAEVSQQILLNSLADLSSFLHQLAVYVPPPCM